VTEPTLSTGALRRALLDRQMLLDRSTLGIPQVLERMGGLQAQYAPSAYIGLWSRVVGFERDQLTSALAERAVVQATLMRSTIHLVSADDYPILAAGTRRARREWWLRVQGEAAKDIDMEAAAALVRDLLTGGPRRQRELVAGLEAAGHPRRAWNGIGAFVDLLRVPPSGTWEHRRADLFALADEWLGRSEVREEAGLEHIIRRYLGGFGPASQADIASWSGVPVTWLRPVIDGMRLDRARDDAGEALLDLPGSVIPDADTRVPARFLPTWDAMLLVHARRTGILPEEHRPKLFSSRTPHSFPSFIVGGAVAGTWRYEAGRIALEPFGPLAQSARRQLEKEAGRLVALYAD
jgi:hypothetical protein